MKGFWFNCAVCEKETQGFTDAEEVTGTLAFCSRACRDQYQAAEQAVEILENWGETHPPWIRGLQDAIHEAAYLFLGKKITRDTICLMKVAAHDAITRYVEENRGDMDELQVHDERDPLSDRHHIFFKMKLRHPGVPHYEDRTFALEFDHELFR